MVTRSISRRRVTMFKLLTCPNEAQPRSMPRIKTAQAALFGCARLSVGMKVEEAKRVGWSERNIPVAS